MISAMIPYDLGHYQEGGATVLSLHTPFHVANHCGRPAALRLRPGGEGAAAGSLAVTVGAYERWAMIPYDLGYCPI